MRPDREPTYAELVDQRQREWADAQRRAAAAWTARHEELKRMPEVAQRPDQTLPWTPGGGVVCPRDGQGTFHIVRFVTLNGVRYRTELKCVNGDFQGTYDWGTAAWLDV